MQTVREDMTEEKLAQICDSLSEQALMEKLKTLFDLETQTVMNSRVLQVGSECYKEGSRTSRSAQQEKTYAVEHRIELLNQSQDEKDKEHSYAHAEAVAQYGEKRVMNHVDASVQALIEVAPALSARIFARRKEVSEAFASAKMVEKLADTDFQILRQYYSSSQKSLHAKFAAQEKTYLQYELDGLQRQLEAMTKMFDKSHAVSQTMGTASEESHRRCDELYQWFCDRALELQYSNSTTKQDCEWRVEEARYAVNKWRHATSAELESTLQDDICRLEDEYIERVEGLSRELEELRQREYGARLERLRLHNLASIPPFALKAAAHAREEQEVGHLEGALKLGSGANPVADETPPLSFAYHTDSGSHIVELATASHLAEEQLADDLHALLASVSAWQTQNQEQVTPPNFGSAVALRTASARTSHQSRLGRSLKALLQAAQKARKQRDLESIPSPAATNKTRGNK